MPPNHYFYLFFVWNYIEKNKLKKTSVKVVGDREKIHEI